MPFSCRILLVEHDPDQRALLSSFLQRQPGLKLLPPAASGGEALTRIPADRPDLVLLDAGAAPDGLSVLEALAMNGTLPALPVLLLTCRQDVRLANAALALGAKCVLTLPLDLSCLRRRIETFGAETNSPVQMQLRWMGLDREGVKFQQCCQAAEALLAMDDPCPQMKQVYLSVAKRWNTAPENVAKNVERAIRAAHEEGRDAYRALFGTPEKPPSVQTFLLRLTQGLRRS